MGELWFWLAMFLLAGWAVLDGFALGTGVLHRLVAGGGVAWEWGAHYRAFDRDGPTAECHRPEIPAPERPPPASALPQPEEPRR